MLLIVYISQKSCTLGTLLAVSYLLSVSSSSNEYFQDMMDSDSEESAPVPDGVVPPPMTEGFLPNMGLNQDVPKDNSTVDNDNESQPKENSNSSVLSTVNCLNNYTPDNLGVGNVCAPMDTYEGEFNTQGLNYPIGYDSEVINGGSKLVQK